MICPRCNSASFRDIDCGPDGYDDDITYTSNICNNCGLWFDGWRNKWYADCECESDVEHCEEYNFERARKGMEKER